MFSLFSKNLKLSECFNRYFRHLKAEAVLASSSILKYQEISSKLSSEIFLGDINIKKINQQTVQELKIKLNGRNLSASRKNHFLIVLSGLLKYLKEVEQVRVYPYPSITKYRVPNKKIVVFSEKQLKELISIIPIHIISGLRFKALICCLISSACRLGEVLSLDKDDINYKTGVVEVRIKGGKTSQVVFNEEAREAIRAYSQARKDFHSALFVTLNQCNPMRWKVGDAGRVIRQFGLKNGIKDLHAHKIRKSSATILYQNGAPLSVVQRYLSHSSPATAVKYYLGDVEFGEVQRWQKKAMSAIFNSAEEFNNVNK